MAARNPKTRCKVVPLYFPATTTATQTLNNSAPNLDVDCKGFTHALVFAVGGDLSTAGTDTLTVQFKETDTAGSAYSNVTSAALTALAGDVDYPTPLGEISLAGRKRYLSATLTEAGTFSGIVTVIVVLMHPEDSALAAQTYAFSV